MNAHHDDDLNRLFAPLREFPAPSPENTDRIMAEILRDAANNRDSTFPSRRQGRVNGKMWAMGVSFALPLAILILIFGDRLRIPSQREALTSPVTTTIRPGVVRFVLVAPEAKQVSVAGSFNSWDTVVTPLERGDSEGVWTADVELPTGWHSYMFVVDGKHWVADPTTPHDPGTEFGPSNSAVMVIAHNSL